MHGVDDYPDAQTIPGLAAYRYDAPLHHRAGLPPPGTGRRRSAARAGGWFVLNVEASAEADVTALGEMDALRDAITVRGGIFALAAFKQDLLARLRGVFVLAGKIGADQLFPTLPTAVGAYRKRAAEHHG